MDSWTPVSTYIPALISSLLTARESQQRFLCQTHCRAAGDGLGGMLCARRSDVLGCGGRWCGVLCWSSQVSLTGWPGRTQEQANSNRRPREPLRFGHYGGAGLLLAAPLSRQWRGALTLPETQLQSTARAKRYIYTTAATLTHSAALPFTCIYAANSVCRHALLLRLTRARSWSCAPTGSDADLCTTTRAARCSA